MVGFSVKVSYFLDCCNFPNCYKEKVNLGQNNVWNLNCKVVFLIVFILDDGICHYD